MPKRLTIQQLPFPVEDEAELEASVASLTHPRVDKHADILARHGENGFGESGRRNEHGAPLVRVVLLLRSLNS